MDVVHVPYRGAAGAIQDTMTGNLSFLVDTFAPLLQPRREGQPRVIAVRGGECAAVTPELQTAREDGLDVVMRITSCISAASRAPVDRVERPSAAAGRVMASPEMASDLASIAYVPVTGSTPDSARDFIAREVALLGAVIRAANVEIT